MLLLLLRSEKNLSKGRQNHYYVTYVSVGIMLYISKLLSCLRYLNPYK